MKGGPFVSYLDKILQPGERVLVTGRLHWVIFVPAFLPLAAAVAIAIWAATASLDPGPARVGYTFAGVLALAGVAILLARLVMRWTTQFAVTNHRIVVKRGLLALHTIEMNIDKVESVDVDQSLLGRMLDFGAVTVHGTGARWDPIAVVADPLRFRNAITSQGQGLDASPASARPAPAADTDLAFWDAMADKNDPDLLEEYLIRFPEGRFAGLARTKLARKG
ncbi:MAG TPA: PH domain-containing protein [Caulobacteraceae bacterium]